MKVVAKTIRNDTINFDDTDLGAVFYWNGDYYMTVWDDFRESKIAIQLTGVYANYVEDNFDSHDTVTLVNTTMKIIN